MCWYCPGITWSHCQGWSDWRIGLWNSYRQEYFQTSWGNTNSLQPEMGPAEMWMVVKRKNVWRRRRLSWINLQSLWRCKAFKARGGDLFYYSSAGTLHKTFESVIYHYFIEPVVSTVNFTHSWTLPSSVRWIFVRNRNWVSWLALPHSSSGLSNSTFYCEFFFFFSSGARFKFLQVRRTASTTIMSLRIFAEDLIMFLNKSSLK